MWFDAWEVLFKKHRWDLWYAEESPSIQNIAALALKKKDISSDYIMIICKNINGMKVESMQWWSRVLIYYSK